MTTTTSNKGSQKPPTRSVFTKSLSVPEGPVALLDGSWLVVEGGAGRGCVTQITPDGSSNRIVARTGEPNGLAVDKDGFIWVAELRNPPSLLRVSLDGKIEIIATEFEDEQFLFPNDLCFGPDGALYLTDSGFLMEDFAPAGKIRSDYMDLKMDGSLYRVDRKDHGVEKLDGNIECTNGLAFGPDNSLYVAETRTGAIFRYEWKGGGKLGPREAFANVLDNSWPGWKGPDGMAFGMDGNLYIAVFGQQEVVVLSRDGAILQRIKTAGRKPTNLAFGLPGQKKIYVTECEFGQMEVYDVGVDGLPLWL